MKKIRYYILFMLSLTAMQAQNNNVISELVILNVKTGKEKVILRENRHFEAPNWSRDGNYLIINHNGLLEKVSIKGKTKKSIINTSFANRCNNDHGLSFDGKWLIISNNDPHISSADGSSRIYILPSQGGTPRLITANYPSYWHGISPDNQWVVYCAMRNGEWDIWKAHTILDQEKRLTDTPGLDDGPEYSYDGKWIYFNSHRTGRMHIYRMRPDGSDQEQLTNDSYDNWFPHPGPDNQYCLHSLFRRSRVLIRLEKM